jgi:hypothetical protein
MCTLGMEQTMVFQPYLYFVAKIRAAVLYQGRTIISKIQEVTSNKGSECLRQTPISFQGREDEQKPRKISRREVKASFSIDYRGKALSRYLGQE